MIDHFVLRDGVARAASELDADVPAHAFERASFDGCSFGETNDANSGDRLDDDVACGDHDVAFALRPNHC